MKLVKKASLLSLVFLLLITQISVIAAPAKKSVKTTKKAAVQSTNSALKSINVQIAAELKKKPQDRKAFGNLLNKLINAVKPKAYNKVYSTNLSDIDKDNIPEVFALYSNSKKVTMNLTILRWDKKTSTYISKLSKDITDIQKATFNASSLFAPKLTQYVISYETPKKATGIMIFNCENGSYKAVYNFKGDFINLEDIDKDKQIEIGGVTVDPKNKDSFKRVWEKWSGNGFKQIKTETLTKAQYESEVKYRKELADQQAQKKALEDNVKIVLATLKPKDYQTVDGYTVADLDNDKVQELVAIYKKTSAGKDYEMQFYKFDKTKSTYQSIYSKDFTCEKVANLVAYDFNKGGNLEVMLVANNANKGLDLKVYTYNNGTVAELTSTTTDIIQDVNNDGIIEIGSIKQNTSDPSKSTIDWQKWDGSRFVTVDIGKK